MSAAIEVRGLRKDYRAGLGGREVKALAGIEFAVRSGELFGLLGPNGAGKTTTVKILLGLTHATAGSASLLGKPVADPESRRRVGYLPEGHRFPGYLTARQTLSIFGRMSGVSSRALSPRIEDLLGRLKLSEWIDVKVKKFSKGMTQRLGLAAALVHEPEVLLLDEPTDGVDPVGRREIRDLLKAEAAKGRAILLNSHLLSEIELTCDRVAVLRNGCVAAMGTIDELTKREEKKDSLKVYKLVASGIDDTVLGAFRETGAGARWTLVAYFALSSLFILIFAVAVNLDVVNGALAGAKIFGQNVHMGRQSVDLDKLVLGFESGFAGFLYVVGTFLAIFATAHLVPRLMEKGTVDLYLSRPVGRVPLLLSRYAGGMLLSASNVIYLLGAMWLLVIWKTHLVHPRFFFAAGIILFGIAALMAFAFLIGTLTSSTAVSIMATFAVFFLSAIL